MKPKKNRHLFGDITKDIRNLKEDINKLKYIFINDNNSETDKCRNNAKKVLNKIDEIKEILNLNIYTGE